MASDNELLTRIKAGDREALAALYARYFPSVWRFAASQLHPDDAAARDAVSETFLAAIRTIHQMDDSKGTVAMWLMGIARHKIADARRQRRHASVDAIETPAPDQDPAHHFAARETQNTIARILAQLDDDQRLALEWKYVDDLSVRDIAARLGRTEKAAEALLFRAREEFRKRSAPLKQEQSHDRPL